MFADIHFEIKRGRVAAVHHPLESTSVRLDRGIRWGSLASLTVPRGSPCKRTVRPDGSSRAVTRKEVRGVPGDLGLRVSVVRSGGPWLRSHSPPGRMDGANETYEVGLGATPVEEAVARGDELTAGVALGRGAVESAAVTLSH